MALMEAIKSLRGVGSKLRYINHYSDSSPLGVNFRKVGPSFGVYDFDAFVEYAKRFYQEGINSGDASYTVVELSGGRRVVDYNGEVRGIYTAKGKPLAFFRPDYKAAGYRSKTEELHALRAGKAMVWS